jgi:drug/metabolite transporter (DMT)-like permease
MIANLYGHITSENIHEINSRIRELTSQTLALNNDKFSSNVQWIGFGVVFSGALMLKINSLLNQYRGNTAENLDFTKFLGYLGLFFGGLILLSDLLSV